MRVPDLFMHDDCIGSMPRRQQAVQILMVMERIPAGPIYQLDVRVVPAPTIEIELFSRTLEHIGDTRHGNEGTDRIESGRETRASADEGMRTAEPVFTRVTDAKATARETNLADDRCQ